MNTSADHGPSEPNAAERDQSMNKTDDPTKDKFIAVGIDFGTTYSGIFWTDIQPPSPIRTPWTGPKWADRQPAAGSSGLYGSQFWGNLAKIASVEEKFLKISSVLEAGITPWSAAENSSTALQMWSRFSRRTSDFSSGRKQYFIQGQLGRTPLEAFPDSGADMCFISPSMASSLSLNVTPGTGRTIHLANKKPATSPGMVRVPWTFSGESTAQMLECWVLPGSVHSLVLGNKFLRATQTLTKFASRIKSRIVNLPKRLRLRLLGEEKQRLWGYLDGHLTPALPDTGSDVMLISREYAERIGLTIDGCCENWLEVEFADGSTTWTSGVVRDVPWSVGGKTVRCNFHVLDDLCVDVVLSNDYLFETRVFTEHSNCFFDTDSEQDLFQLCNIRLIGRFCDTLSGLEDEYLEDVVSLNAFGPEMVQRELCRRDRIRDEILGLPATQREAASQAEAERQRRWQALRDAHRQRWAAGASLASSSLNQEPAHRTATDVGSPQSPDRPPVREAAGNDTQQRPARRTWWKKRVSVSIPLRYLTRNERVP